MLITRRPHETESCACPKCDSWVPFEPVVLPDDQTCPHCGAAVWFGHSMVAVFDFVHSRAVVNDLQTADQETALVRLLDLMIDTGGLPVDRYQESLDAVLKRARLGTTGVGGGLAIPHARLAGLPTLVGAIGRAPQGIDFGSIDQEPVHTIFLLLSNANDKKQHIHALAEISRFWHG